MVCHGPDVLTRASVIHLDAYIISDTISESRDWQFMAWFVMVLMSLNPVYHHFEWKFIDNLEDTL